MNEQVRYMILAAQRQGNRILEERFRQIGLTSSQAEVLSLLDKYEPLSLKELGAMLVCESGSPSRLVNAIVKAGLIERKPDSRDGRVRLLQLTEEGRNKLPKLQAIEDELYGYLDRTWPQEEKRQMIELLQRFLKDLPIAKALKRRALWEGNNEKKSDH
ncbi:MAG TPA: MarR family transcriptional regulator [Bacillales bacterium]|nr:MarR family transcriptional regulator [Bacillales bacterium]